MIFTFIWVLFTAGLVCYVSCLGAVGAGVVVGGPAALGALGFGASGVVAGSWAAWWMSMYGGKVAAGSIYAILQGVGATGGVLNYTGIPYINAVCNHLCYDYDDHTDKNNDDHTDKNNKKN